MYVEILFLRNRNIKNRCYSEKSLMPDSDNFEVLDFSFLLSVDFSF